MLKKISSIKSKIKKNDFASSVVTLISGTAFAQAITIAALPILTRLYTPESFGVLATFISVTLIVSTAACLRLDIAIPTAHDEQDAKNLLIASFFLSATTSIVSFAIFAALHEEIQKITNSENTTIYAALASLGIFLASTFNAVQFWATRSQQFKVVAKTRANQAILGTSFQIASGILIKHTPIGLVVGQIINTSAGIASIYRKTLKGKIKASDLNPQGIINTVKRFGDYPKYSTAEALFNSASTQAPIIIISTLYLGAEAGFLMLAMKAMQAPMRLIGSSIGQVYLSKAPLQYRDGNLSNFTLSVIVGLLKTGVGPIIFCGIVAPSVFSIIFGPEWERAGTLIAWMTPWFVMQFLTSPIAMALHITKNQKPALAIQAFGLISRVSIVVLSIAFFENLISEAYAISGLIFYLVYFFAILKYTKIQKTFFSREIKSAAPVILSWIAISILTKIAIQAVTP